MSEEQRPQGTIPGVRNDRFGWQPGDRVVFYDEADNEISLDEWRRRIREATGDEEAPRDR